MPELLEMLPSDLLEETQQRFYIKRKGRIEVRNSNGEIIAMLKASPGSVVIIQDGEEYYEEI